MATLNKSKFPSALTRDSGLGPSLRESATRKGPTAAQIAMLTADEYKRYMQRMGQWQEAALENAKRREAAENPESRKRDFFNADIRKD